MSFDGACSQFGSGVGIVLKIPQASIYPHSIMMEFPWTNNEVEYEALIQGMIIVLHMKVENMVVTWTQNWS
jgi:ribonuclease HI